MDGREWVWKWVAIGLVLGVIVYEVIWPRISAGQQALNYLNACIQAKVCPSGEVLSQQLAAQTAQAAKAKETQAPAANATPPTAAPKDGGQ